MFIDVTFDSWWCIFNTMVILMSEDKMTKYEIQHHGKIHQGGFSCALGAVMYMYKHNLLESDGYKWEAV